jgi:hypothetical protein
MLPVLIYQHRPLCNIAVVRMWVIVVDIRENLARQVNNNFVLFEQGTLPVEAPEGTIAPNEDCQRKILLHRKPPELNVGSTRLRASR